MQTKQIDINKVDWVIDPIQDDNIREKMRLSTAFAESLMKDKTKLFFDFLKHKPAWREPATIEIMGETRSGKSTLGTGICKFLSKITLTAFDLPNICPNETVWLNTIKKANAPDGTSWLIDEQTETHAGAGSYTEMQLLEDVQNICAKKSYNTTWCHPHEFVGRMAQVGIAMFGKNPDMLLLRGIMYNLAQKSLKNMPMGIIVFPIGWMFPCGLFGKRIKHLGQDTIITCNERVCPNYKTCNYFMGRYEHQKDEKIEEVLTHTLRDREKERIDIIENIANNPQFQKCKSNPERMAVARFLVPFGTPEKLITEYVAVAKSMRVSIEDMKALIEGNTKIMEDME